MAQESAEKMNDSAETLARSAVPLSDSDAWHVVRRWQAFDGEIRANHLRVLSVAAFYFVHLLQHCGWTDLSADPGSNDGTFHLAVTVIALVWLLMSLAVDLSLRQQLFPTWTAWGTTALDLALLTSVLCLGGGQQSPLVLGYLLIPVLASLRFHLTLIRVSTLGSMIGYLFLMAIGRWPWLIADRTIGVVPRYAQLMTLLAIGIVGIMLGQLIRRVRVMSVYYASRRGTDADA